MKCASTESEAGAWWAVYIGGPHRVTKVSITNTIGTTGKFSTIHHDVFTHEDGTNKKDIKFCIFALLKIKSDFTDVYF